MRDPEGELTLTEEDAVRSLRTPAGSEHFLRSSLASDLIREGMLIEYSLRDNQTAVSTRLRFVSQPTEWCDAQLFDAAVLTLDIQRRATEAGYDMKDASAWNILFAGTRPVFCDLLSFQPQERDKWWAAGQFARHFIVPLWLAQRRGLHGMDSFKCWRDGVDPQQARALLGATRYLHRCWPVVAGASKAEYSDRHTAPRPPTARSQAFRSQLYASLRWMLDGVRPTGHRAAKASLWSGYADDRDHYPESSLTDKRRLVSTWLAQHSPAWVADFGCNTGEFSTLALEGGANVVAVDADHACIERLYLSNPGHPRLHPVLASLDDLSGGRGWAGVEQPGLHTRMAGRFDMVLMLAVIHHLAVGASIPLLSVARLARACTRKQLVVEWIHQEDVQLVRLAHQRCRDPNEFSLHHQRQAFLDAGFVIESEQPLAPAARTLALLRVAA